MSKIKNNNDNDKKFDRDEFYNVCTDKCFRSTSSNKSYQTCVNRCLIESIYEDIKINYLYLKK